MQHIIEQLQDSCTEVQNNALGINLELQRRDAETSEKMIVESLFAQAINELHAAISTLTVLKNHLY